MREHAANLTIVAETNNIKLCALFLTDASHTR